MWTLNIYGFRFGALLELLGWFFWEYESLVKKVSLSIYLILASETLKDDERASYVVSTLILYNRDFCVLLSEQGLSWDLWLSRGHEWGSRYSWTL